MPLWKPAPIEAEPEVVLLHWRIMQTETGERHFVGEEGPRAGRVSSAIAQFDPKLLRGVTKSGRVYQLEGKPGSSPDARYVWARWKQMNHVQSELDVTSAVLATGHHVTPDICRATTPISPD